MEPDLHEEHKSPGIEIGRLQNNTPIVRGPKESSPLGSGRPYRQKPFAINMYLQPRIIIYIKKIEN